MAKQFWAGVTAMGTMFGIVALELAKHGHAGGLLAIMAFAMGVAFYVGRQVTPNGT